MFDDVASSALKVALGGLSARQRVIADNISNVETPNYLAGKVQFESALQDALNGGGPISSVTPTMSRSLEPTRTDGNNVNLDEETVSGITASMQYQLALRAMDGKYNLLHDVIKG